MTWLSKVRELEERLFVDCGALDRQDAKLIFTAKLPREDVRLRDATALEAFRSIRGQTMLTRLKLPVLDHGNLLVEVSIVGPKAARTKFSQLISRAGLLIPQNLRPSLARFEAVKGRMDELGLFLSWLWQLENNRRIATGDSTWLELDDDGCEFVFGISEPVRLTRLLLRCFRENPGGEFVLPAEDGQKNEPDSEREVRKPCRKGVSRFDAAYLLQLGNKADQSDCELRKVAHEMAQRWGKLRSINWKLLMIGLDPFDRQCFLFDVVELVKELVNLEPRLVIQLGGEKKLVTKLRKKAREPLPVNQSVKLMDRITTRTTRS